MNCLLGAFSICVDEVNVFFLKVMVLFLGCVEIEGSLAFCALMLFLCYILCLMCSGSSLPFGMLCLSAWRMMFVKMVFAVCMSGGG